MYEDPIAKKIKEDFENYKGTVKISSLEEFYAFVQYIEWEKKNRIEAREEKNKIKRQKLKTKEDRKIRLRRKQLIDKYKVKKGCCMCGFNASHTALSFVVDKGIEKRTLTVSKKIKHIKEYFNYLKQGRVTCRNCIAIYTSKEIKTTSSP